MDKHLLGTLAGIGIVADLAGGLISRDMEKHRARIAEADADYREWREAHNAAKRQKALDQAREREWAKGAPERERLERERVAKEAEAQARARAEAEKLRKAEERAQLEKLDEEWRRERAARWKEEEAAYEAQLKATAAETAARQARTIPAPADPQAFYWGPEAKRRYALRKENPDLINLISPLYNLAYRESAGNLINDAADLVLTELETAEQHLRATLTQLPAHLKAKLFAFAPELATEQDAINADAHREHWFKNVQEEIARTRYGDNWEESRVVADIVPTTDLRELYRPAAHVKHNLLIPAQMAENERYEGPAWLPAESREDLYPPMLSEGMVYRGVRLPTEATQCLRSALSGLPQDWATANRSDTAAAAVPKATYHAMLDRMENHAMRSLLLDALENPEQVQAMKEGLERAREIAKVEQEALEHALAGVGHELAKQDPHSPRRLSENTPEGRKNLYLLYQERLAVALYDRVEAGVWSLPESVDIHNEILDEGLPSNESAVERRRLRECAQQLADTFDLNRDFDLPILNGMGEPDSVRITPEQDPMRIAMARHPHKP